MIDLVTYQEIHYGQLTNEEWDFQCFLKGFVPTLRCHLEDLAVLREKMETSKLNDILLSRLYLIAAASLEPTLKLLLAPLRTSEGHRVLFLPDTRGVEFLHSHELEDLYAAFLMYRPDLVPPLSRSQKKCLRAFNSVLKVTARYRGKWMDLLSLRSAQIAYLTFLEKLPGEDERLSASRTWICDMIGEASEEKSLPDLIQEGWNYLQADCNQVLNMTLDTLKNLLVAFDPEKMTDPHKSRFVLEKCSESLLRVYKTFCGIQNTILPDWPKLDVDSLLDEVKEIRDIHALRLFSSRLNYIERDAINECETILESVPNFFSSCLEVNEVGYDEACILLLKEAVLLEQVYQALLSRFPIIHEPSGDHLLLSPVGKKTFLYCHFLERSLEKLLPYLLEHPSASEIDFERLKQRSKLLEPVLKKLYRYQDLEKQDEAQTILDVFHFLDRLRFALKHDMISDEDKTLLEVAAAAYDRSFSQNDLNFVARGLLQSLIIRPFDETLVAVVELVKILR